MKNGKRDPKPHQLIGSDLVEIKALDKGKSEFGTGNYYLASCLYTSWVKQ